MPDTTTYRADEVTQFGDVALVEAVYELVLSLDDGPIADEFYFLLSEAFERFAPNIELDVNRARIIEGEGPHWEGAFADHIQGRADRYAARLTARAERQLQETSDA